METTLWSDGMYVDDIIILMITWSRQHGSLHVHPKMAMLSKTHPLRQEAARVPYYSSIVQAVNSARDGDRIVIHPGVYCEQVVIYKNIILIGSDVNGMKCACVCLS